MTRDEYDRVLDEEVIVRDGKKYAWTIPLAFPVDRRRRPGRSRPATTRAAGQRARARSVGVLEVSDVYPVGQGEVQRRSSTAPTRDRPPRRPHDRQGRPADATSSAARCGCCRSRSTRSTASSCCRRARRGRCSREKGWQRVVAFQTRNPLHRAHEYALVVGLERLTREGHFAGAVLNPLVGETKGDDVDAATRMRTYRALIDNKALGQGDKDEELWKKVGRDVQRPRASCSGLDIKMFYAGPKEAVMHAIYRQNFGFTDIVIGRKHADAPYDDGKDIWDGLAAQRKFDELKGELLIKPVKVGFAAFYEELGRVGLVDEYGPKGYKQVSISGRELREKLRAGELPDPRIMRPETAKVLIERMKQGSWTFGERRGVVQHDFDIIVRLTPRRSPNHATAIW